MNEVIADGVDVKGAGVIGCRRHKRYAMVTAMVEGGERTRFVDVFLTREMAVELRDKLNAVIARDEGVEG